MATYSDDVDISINWTQLDKDILPWEVKPSSAAEPFSDPPEEASPDKLENYDFELTWMWGCWLGDKSPHISPKSPLTSTVHIQRSFSQRSSRQESWSRDHSIIAQTLGFLPNSFGDSPMSLVSSESSPSVHVSDITHGLHPTVWPTSIEEEVLAWEHLSQWAPPEFHAVVVFQVPDDGDERGFREVIAWGSMSDAQSLTGRETQGWPVYDLKAEKVAFLKDSWRSLLDHLEKKSCILKELTNAKVRNVPKYICGDNLGQSTLDTGICSKWNGLEGSTCNCYPQALKLGFGPLYMINVYGTNPTTQKTE